MRIISTITTELMHSTDSPLLDWKEKRSDILSIANMPVCITKLLLFYLELLLGVVFLTFLVLLGLALLPVLFLMEFCATFFIFIMSYRLHIFPALYFLLSYFLKSLVGKIRVTTLKAIATFKPLAKAKLLKKDQ